MNNARKPNAMLIELVIVILFFAISAGIVLQLFAAAGNRSIENTMEASAVLYAEDAAEQFLASPLAVEEYFAQAPWIATEDGHQMQLEAGGRALTLTARAAQEEISTGILDSLQITVDNGNRTIVELPVVRYTQKEGTP